MRAAAGLLQAALAIGAVTLVACPLPVPFSERLFFERSVEATPRAADCERCHLEIYEEWRESLHASAWTSEAFQAASAQGRAAECRGCHVPAPIVDSGAVKARAVHLEEGVTCISCHLSTQPGAEPLTMRGPVSRSSPVEAHPVFDEDPVYRSSQLCGRCHRAALEEWEAAAVPSDRAEKPSCQECHMPEVARRVESVHPDHPYSVLFVALERRETLRRHLFTVPDEVDRHVSLEVTPRNLDSRTVLQVVLRNELPHALPTGEFGRREIRLVAEWPGGSTEHTLVRSLGESIAGGGRAQAALALPAHVEAASVQVRLERWHHESGSWVTLVQAPPS